MKTILREITSFIIHHIGISYLLRNTYALNKVPILLYHDPKPSTFENHIKFLSKRYNFINLDLLVKAIHSKDFSIIPKKSLVITFDDGHLGNYKLLDIIKRYNICPTIFICSKIVDSDRGYWWNMDNLNYRKIQLDYNNKKEFNLYRSQIWVKELTKQFELHTKRKEYCNERQSLNQKEINDMSKYCDFQSHTQYHPFLTFCTMEQCLMEIQESKTDVEKITDKKCLHFAYPAGYYSNREVEIVEKSGYYSARTIDVGWNDCNTDPYRLKITGVTDDASINMLVAQLSGISMYLRYLWRGSFKGKFNRQIN